MAAFATWIQNHVWECRINFVAYLCEMRFYAYTATEIKCIPCVCMELSAEPDIRKLCKKNQLQVSY